VTATFGESALPRANLATRNTPDTFGTEDMARQRSKTESIFLCLCFSKNGCQKIHCKHPKGLPGTCANCLMNVSSLVFENQRSSWKLLDNILILLVAHSTWDCLNTYPMAIMAGGDEKSL
jgi:hypothetical protein